MSIDMFSVPLKELKHELLGLCQPPISEVAASKYQGVYVVGVKRKLALNLYSKY